MLEYQPPKHGSRETPAAPPSRTLPHFGRGKARLPDQRGAGSEPGFGRSAPPSRCKRRIPGCERGRAGGAGASLDPCFGGRRFARGCLQCTKAADRGLPAPGSRECPRPARPAFPGDTDECAGLNVAGRPRPRRARYNPGHGHPLRAARAGSQARARQDAGPGRSSWCSPPSWAGRPTPRPWPSRRRWPRCPTASPSRCSTPTSIASAPPRTALEVAPVDRGRGRSATTGSGSSACPAATSSPT